MYNKYWRLQSMASVFFYKFSGRRYKRLKRLIAMLTIAFAILSFAGCEHSGGEPDCCKKAESIPDDCCESTVAVSTFESDIPDCCGE